MNKIPQPISKENEKSSSRLSELNFGHLEVSLRQFGLIVPNGGSMGQLYLNHLESFLLLKKYWVRMPKK